PFQISEPFFAVKSKAVLFGRMLSAQGQIADQIPDAPFAFFIASAAHCHPEPARKALTVFHAPEAAPPRIAFEPERIEFSPRSAIEDFDYAFDANDVIDLQIVKQGEQIVVRKPTIGCEPNPRGFDELKDQLESAFDDGQFIAFHPALEDRLLVGAPE